MALDESRKGDEVFHDREITYVIENKLFEEVKPIKIDFVNSAMGSGFTISSGLPKTASCGSSCSC